MHQQLYRQSSNHNYILFLFLQYANFGFYQSLEESCCGKLQHTEFPVFKPSTSEVRAGQVSTSPHAKPSVRDSAKLDMTGPITTSLSLALSLGIAFSLLYSHCYQTFHIVWLPVKRMIWFEHTLKINRIFHLTVHFICLAHKVSIILSVCWFVCLTVTTVNN